MNKRQIVKLAIEGQSVPYVPWHFTFTKEARDTLTGHFKTEDLHGVIDDHIIELGSPIGFFEDIGHDRFRDVFGVVWNRSVDKDIGIVEGLVLQRPTMNGYSLPDPLDKRFFADVPSKITQYQDCFRVFCIGFSLFERAWTLRGMENLLMDFHEHPGFVKELFHAITDYNITLLKEAVKYDIDAIYFGDDWGQQSGLIMGPQCWREFILPELRRMYDSVHKAGKYVMIHSCGDVAQLFDDLVDAGLNCFNPFQPEVMDVHAIAKKYKKKLCFCGGLSTQKTLPFGSADDVKKECLDLIEMGSQGGYILCPAHAVEGDVCLENMLAMINTAKNQQGYLNS